MTLTRRCPLTCAHCSTNSMLSSEEHDASIFLRFAGTFSPESHPQVLWLTGGEPLLRPGLVEAVAAQAHAAGTLVAMITGGFFARTGRIARPLRRAIDAVDHVIVSLDVFHEVQVRRTEVFRLVRELVDDGRDVSFQIVGTGSDDPYLDDVTSHLREYFDGRVPALVAPLGSAGRAAEWLPAPKASAPHFDAAPAPLPCTMAAWPVVAFDGTVVACCNQTVVDGPPPEHLRLGHASVDDWATIRERCVRSTALRAIRVLGPQAIEAQYGGGGCDGYCSTCVRLADEPGLLGRVDADFDRPVAEAMEEQVVAMQRRSGPIAFAERFGIRAYADLLSLGYSEEGSETCVA
jgi:pyruvate-formate lyase-activating enzyme